VDYNDYVYDLVVPKYHNFIGGEMPTLFHNTQIGLTLAVNAQRPVEEGGANGKVIFIDTESTFTPDRVRQIARELGLNEDEVINNIFVAKAFNFDHQILLLEKIKEIVKSGEPIKLLIIDSMTSHLRSDYQGRGQLADRQQKLNHYLHELGTFAEINNIAIYYTNQVMSNPGMMFGDPTTPIGGNILSHWSFARLYLRRGKQGSRVAKLVDSPNLPENDAIFQVTEKGVTD